MIPRRYHQLRYICDRYGVPFPDGKTYFDTAFSQVREALSLPLKNGYLDGLGSIGADDMLGTLVDKVPELFPPTKLELFRRLADDLKLNGHQTIRIEQISRAQS